MRNVGKIGSRLDYRVPGAGSPVLLIHGLCSSGADWAQRVPALERWSATDRLDRLRSSILLIAAEHDFTPLPEKRALAERIGAKLVVVRDSRHGTPFDAIELTNACLVAHLNDRPMPARDTWVRDAVADAPAWLLAAGIAEEHAASGNG